MTDLYYKILEYNGKLTVVCLQWFDEYDYDQNDFLVDEDGEQYIFYDEQEAIDWLNENVKEELIDEEYAKNKSNQNMRDKYLK